MSNELISVRAWIEKHSFDQGDSFSFLVGKTLDGVMVRSLTTKVSETALDSYLTPVRAAQKRKLANNGIKKAKSDKPDNSGSGNVIIRRIKPKVVAQKPLPPKNDVRVGDNAKRDIEMQKGESPEEIQETTEQEEIKFCSECGKKLKIKAKYCTKCGTKQEE